jgi:hypothetical protein
MAFGLTERFDETVLLFAKELGWNHLLFGVANRSGEKVPVTPGILDACRPLIEQDVLLYQHASKVFDERIEAEGPRFRDAVAAYRAVLAEARGLGAFKEGRVILGEAVDPGTARTNQELPLPPAVRDYLAG